jgi:NAD(P)-dependent dehydrogenase (short-subunit alcohol dehydrogenase family)
MGLETARALALQGATVIMVGRNPQTGAAVLARIREETRNPSVAYMLADLSVQAQVRSLAQEFEKRYSRLDVLVNNAGAFFLRRRVSADGIEMTFALNYLSPFLLTNLLLSMLKASAPARIINISSIMHKTVRIDFDNLEGKRWYNGVTAYGLSKLALLMFTYELARRLKGTQVTVNALHPGFVGTNIYSSAGGIVKAVAPLIKLITLKPKEGAQTSIYLASSPEVVGVTGQYYSKGQPVPASPASYDRADAQRLWEVSAQMTGL